MTSGAVPPHYFIKEPIPAIFEVCGLLSAAADAHLNGERQVADALFCQADMREIWNWINPDWEKPHLNVRNHQPEGDTQEIPKTMRDPVRHPPLHVKAAVLARDGYRCRYCGIPVIHADIRKIAHALYPDAVPWQASDPGKQHAAFQCLWLQYDHVVPHSHGGASAEENIVISCALCNFGKDRYTLRQLGLCDPRLRPPTPILWNGLECLRACALPRSRRPKASAANGNVREALEAAPPKTGNLAYSNAFFLPGSWIRGEYLYTPTIAGKERWFKIGQELIAEPATRNGINGCRLLCDPALFRRRGLSPEAFLDPEQIDGAKAVLRSP
ncbi:5-methylcytosine-specific restriction endonuclease McrA [Rhizobium aethiopicum]|uniref:5-methylcytosine-specific restriction endonuclease McrA n=1 Tax=Rhizobium aethiopicum TaxID=1138170 RepID=A0A7W6MJW3_9HYPH|nr:HNH endonuclease [Rhizobium aethiopicum]MBB4193036.1 5-methylcytosine-specific restriction endonuclease McrA [Rhizobium aethiopicum]MBB4579297.1 5-methylcytosine-specific restriction endonuclease McrA [Rhizobium aethiopicum]